MKFRRGYAAQEKGTKGVRHFATAERTEFVHSVDIAYTLKLIDVSTGGIVSSQSGEAYGNATAWYEEECSENGVQD